MSHGDEAAQRATVERTAEFRQVMMTSSPM
jgi:hypothetical protein